MIESGEHIKMELVLITTVQTDGSQIISLSVGGSEDDGRYYHH